MCILGSSRNRRWPPGQYPGGWAAGLQRPPSPTRPRRRWTVPPSLRPASPRRRIACSCRGLDADRWLQVRVVPGRSWATICVHFHFIFYDPRTSLPLLYNMNRRLLLASRAYQPYDTSARRSQRGNPRPRRRADVPAARPVPRAHRPPDIGGLWARGAAPAALCALRRPLGRAARSTTVTGSFMAGLGAAHPPPTLHRVEWHWHRRAAFARRCGPPPCASVCGRDPLPQ